MSEMVERVARASFAAYCKRNRLSFTFEDMNDEEHDFAMMHARACIEAMREPTEAMVTAGALRMVCVGDSLPVPGIGESGAASYRRMIDEALK